MTSRNEVDLVVGGRLSSRRLALGFSQDQLAAKVDVTKETVEKWELGMARVPVSNMQKLSDILDVPPAFFFTDKVYKGQVEGRGGAGDVVDLNSSLETLCLLRAFETIRTPASRQFIVEFTEAMATTEIVHQARDEV